MRCSLTDVPTASTSSRRPRRSSGGHAHAAGSASTQPKVRRSSPLGRVPPLRSQSRKRRMVPLWSPAGATGGIWRQIGRNHQRLKQAKPLPWGCDRLPEAAHGMEVGGSSPPEGLPKVPANRHFVVVLRSRSSGSNAQCWSAGTSRSLVRRDGRFHRPALPAPAVAPRRRRRRTLPQGVREREASRTSSSAGCSRVPGTALLSSLLTEPLHTYYTGPAGW
jgi:hypothetical protein